MNKVPSMLSTKDLSYMCDMVNWNIIAINKINLYISNITDEKILTEFRSILDMHIKNVNEIIRMLKEEV